MNDSDRGLYERAIEQWGMESQLLMAIEETAELIVQIAKLFRRKGNLDKFAEKSADAEIMMEQLRVMYPEVAKVANGIRYEKLNKLKEMLGEEVSDDG